MRTQFPGYYRPTPAEFAELWQNCLFALDANVLLNLYGYSEAARERLLGLLEKISPRLRVPHRFALEYQRNRCRAVMEQVKNYSKVEGVLDDLFKKEFAPTHKHPFLDANMLRAFNRFRKALRESREKHEAMFGDDPYFLRLTSALEFRVGPAPSDESLEKLHKEAARRYASSIPPGFKDQDKGEPEAFGDFIGWSQILEIAKEEQKPIILVTDDAKEDWWLLEGNRTIGPRPELISEVLRECNQRFYMYSSDQFLRYAKIYLAEPVESRVIEEVRERLRDQLRESSDAKAVGKSTRKPTHPVSEDPVKPKSEATRATNDEEDSLRAKPSMPSDKKSVEETD